MRLSTALTQVHKWVGLVIGIQVLLWISGGLVMSAFPIELVRGETQAAAAESRPIAAAELGPGLVERLYEIGPVSGFRTVRILDRLWLEVERPATGPLLLDAATGQAIAGIPADTAAEIARRDFTGNGAVVGVELLEARTTEYRGLLPVWRVRLDDVRETSIYVSPTGRVVARRNDVWRLYDFFWMLHIMDYEQRTDFNHGLLIGASALALLLSASGIWLLFYRIRLRRSNRA